MTEVRGQKTDDRKKKIEAWKRSWEGERVRR
jgi:hypothetical protein